MEDYLATIRTFAGNFAPKGFMFCNGQLLAIDQNSALFSLIGTTYGGDGSRTFGLPDLRGRSPIGTGQGPGLSNYALGQQTGTENTTILINNMPSHNHPASSSMTLNVNNQEAEVAVPVAGNALAAIIDSSANALLGYTTKTPTIPLAGGTVATNVGLNGGNLPLSILQPTLAINYVICVSGMFPSRN